MTRERRADPFLFLLLAAFVCYGGWRILYLGLYEDDWAYFNILRQLFPQGATSMASVLVQDPFNLHRPLYILFYVLRFMACGLHPLPNQIVSLGINVILAGSVYQVLQAFSCPKIESLLGAMLFLAYPSKDTTLFWISGFHCPLALLLFLASFLAHLDYARNGKSSALLFSGLIFLASLLLYDSCLFLSPLYLIVPDSTDAAKARRMRSAIAAAGITTVVLFYKLMILPMFAAMPYPLTSIVSFSPTHALIVYIASLNANLGPDQAIYTARAILDALKTSPTLAGFALALPWVATKALGSSNAEEISSFRFRSLVFLGLGFFILGNLPYAISTYMPVSTTHEDRFNLLPALGLVLAGTAFILRLGRARLRPLFLTVAAVALASNIGIAHAWEKAYAEELDVRQILLDHLAEWPKERVLVLHESELFVAGRAPIFEDRLVFEPAVQLWTQDAARRAYVIRPGVEFYPDHILIRKDHTHTELHDGKLTVATAVHPDIAISYDRTVLLDVSRHAFIAHPVYANYSRLSVPPDVHNPFATWVKSFRRPD